MFSFSVFIPLVSATGASLKKERGAPGRTTSCVGLLIKRKTFFWRTLKGRGGQLLLSAGQMGENEVLGGPDYYMNIIQYLDHIVFH